MLKYSNTKYFCKIDMRSDLGLWSLSKIYGMKSSISKKKYIFFSKSVFLLSNPSHFKTISVHAFHRIFPSFFTNFKIDGYLTSNENECSFSSLEWRNHRAPGRTYVSHSLLEETQVAKQCLKWHGSHLSAFPSNE